MLRAEHVSYDVTRDDGTKETILKDISFTIHDGEMVVLTGPNGGGKSTIARTLMGINTATSGKIFLDDTDLTEKNITERARAGIGFAFQQPPRFKGMTVEKFMRLAAGRNVSRSECCDLLGSVGLCAKNYLFRELDGTLSGGEMKRIEIASVLASDHKVLIFDEPEAGIDLWSFSMLVKRFREIHDEKNASLILISHQERIIEMADRIMVIRDGEVEASGTKEEMMSSLKKDVCVSPQCLREEK